MPIAIDPDRAHRYILPEERNQSCPTVFLLRPLCGPDARLAINLEAGGNHSEAIYDIVSICLMGWENFATADGVLVPFESEERVVRGKKRTVAKDSSMQRLDAHVIGELFVAAITYSRLTKTEAKN